MPATPFFLYVRRTPRFSVLYTKITIKSAIVNKKSIRRKNHKILKYNMTTTIDILKLNIRALMMFMLKIFKSLSILYKAAAIPLYIFCKISLFTLQKSL